MSAHMKKHLTNIKKDVITISGKRYIVPQKTIQAILTLILSNPDVKEDSIPYDEIVAEKIKKIGKGAMAFRGARIRESLSQKQFAEKLSIDQAIVSKIENGQIKIDIKLAKKAGELCNINYRVFLQ